MFGNQSKGALGFVRTKQLGIFAVFHLNKSDSCDILACLEHIDQEYGGNVNVLEFGEVFCQENRVVFLYLWESYQTAIGNTPESASFFSVPYTEFLNFLLFFVSLGSKDMVKYVYYVWLFLPKILPLHYESDKINKSRYRITLATLEEIMTKMMGQSNSKKAVQLVYYKKKLKKAVKDDSVEQISFNQFRGYNLVISLAFSKPLVALQTELRATMIGKNIWNRVHHGFTAFMRHPQKALLALDDTDYLFYTDPGAKKKGGYHHHSHNHNHNHNHHHHGESSASPNISPGPGAGMDEHHRHHHHHHQDHDEAPVLRSRTVYRSLGERRDARAELQPFLAFIKNYMELPVDGFKKKKRFHHRKRAAEEDEDMNENNMPPAEDEGHEFDDVEEDTEQEGGSGVGINKHHKRRGFFSRMFGPKEVKVVPVEETNPVIAKYSQKMGGINPEATINADNSAVHESVNASAVASAVSVTMNESAMSSPFFGEEPEEQDLDSIVESILAKGANEAAQYSEVMNEDIDVLQGRARHAAHKAMKLMDEVSAEIEEHSLKQRSMKKTWGARLSSKNK